MTTTGYMRRVAEVENCLDGLSEDQTGTMAQNLSERYIKHRDHLVVFLIILAGRQRTTLAKEHCAHR